MGRFEFLGEGEVLMQKPYEVSAISVSNETVVYAAPVKVDNQESAI